VLWATIDLLNFFDRENRQNFSAGQPYKAPSPVDGLLKAIYSVQEYDSRCSVISTTDRSGIQPTMDEDPLKLHLDRLLSSRQHPKTICPSEVARALSHTELQVMGATIWRDAMPRIRELLWTMRARGEVDILQRGSPIPTSQSLEDTRGPIRARKRLATQTLSDSGP